MANKHYNLINLPNHEINGVTYVCETWDVTLKEFLETHFDKEIYIYAPSLQTGPIKAIVI